MDNPSLNPESKPEGLKTRLNVVLYFSLYIEKKIEIIEKKAFLLKFFIL